MEFLQLDITAYPGNSGGPLLDIRTGKVVGVVNMVVQKGTRGIGAHRAQRHQLCGAGEVCGERAGEVISAQPACPTGAPTPAAARARAAAAPAGRPTPRTRRPREGHAVAARQRRRQRAPPKAASPPCARPPDSPAPPGPATPPS
ncbi:hypothetical protein Ddc_20131 [Ditylenchus destructor]|nr:hypothetical protein Ddc_20131 [Ditylenchus destructor]